MTLINLQIGKQDYNRSKGIVIGLLGAEFHASRTRGGVWSVGIWAEWTRKSWEKTFWK